jgi:hypothetical protein
VVETPAPVEARPAESAALVRGTRRINPERRQPVGAGVGEKEAAGLVAEQAAGDQAVVDDDAELAGEVVVADAGLPERRLARPGQETQRAGAKGDPISASSSCAMSPPARRK